MMLPPLYCISILFGPRLEMVSSAYCLPVIPTVTTRMIDAEPMTMPSMVSRNRALLARKLSTASEITSLKIIVVCALASVLSNDFVSSSGLGTIVVAMVHPSVRARRNPIFARLIVQQRSVRKSVPDTAIRHSSVSQRCGDSC